jgi:proteic killer suppression protein
MIQSFRNKGLGRFYASGSGAEIQPHHATRLRMLTAMLKQGGFQIQVDDRIAA